MRTRFFRKNDGTYVKYQNVYPKKTTVKKELDNDAFYIIKKDFIIKTYPVLELVRGTINFQRIKHD